MRTKSSQKLPTVTHYGIRLEVQLIRQIYPQTKLFPPSVSHSHEMKQIARMRPVQEIVTQLSAIDICMYL